MKINLTIALFIGLVSIDKTNAISLNKHKRRSIHKVNKDWDEDG